MSVTIEQAFIEDFDSEVKLEYQNAGSHLRGTLRTKPQIMGKTARFQKIGVGAATQKARHADIPPMNLNHSYVDVTMEDWYTNEYVDELDELKINIDERGAIARSAAMAQGRRSDDIIFAALDAVNASYKNDTPETWSSAAGPIGIMEEFIESEVPVNEGDTWAVVCPRAWGDLLDLDEFSRAEYISPDQLPLPSGVVTAKRWLGFNWMVHSRNTKNGSNTYNYFYHRQAAGHGIQKDVEGRVGYIDEKWAYALTSAMAQGAIIIEDIGIRVRLYTTS